MATIVPFETARGLRNLCSQYFERKKLGNVKITKHENHFVVEELTEINVSTGEKTWTPQTWGFEELVNYKAMLLDEVEMVKQFESELNAL